MNFNFHPGREIEKDSEVGTVDYFAYTLLREIEDRGEYLEDMNGWITNAPPETPYSPADEDDGFEGAEILQQISATNWPALIVNATVARLGILGFRTAEAANELGDQVVHALFERDRMGTGAQEAMRLACSYSTAYLYVDPATKRQKVLPPNNAAIVTDVFGEPVAALCMFRDRALNRDVLNLFVRNQNPETGEAEGPAFCFVATRELNPSFQVRNRKHDKGLKLTSYDTEVPLRRSMTHDWVWWRTRDVGIERIPITSLVNQDRINEFENHTPHIARINHMVYTRIVIASMQAFRQRAVKGNLPSHDKVTGQKIDYNRMFEASPFALWTLPEGVDLWESSQASFAESLQAVRNDIQDLASVTQTPMSFFSDSLNQSSSGADAQRENGISKVEERRLRFQSDWKRHISILLEINGEKERSEEKYLEVIWAPIQVYSLNERAAAYSQLRGAGMATRTVLREAMGMTPAEIERAQNEIVEEVLTSMLSQAVSSTTPLAKAAQSQVTGFQSQDKSQTTADGSKDRSNDLTAQKKGEASD